MERHGTICDKMAVTTLHCHNRIGSQTLLCSVRSAGCDNIFVHADETFMEEIWISGKSGRRSDANREKNSSDSA